MTDTIQQLDEGQRRVLPKIEALLRLADKGKNSSPEEAASAAAKAQELLLAYNLDSSLVGAGGEDGRREEQKTKGGFYLYQRDLWKAVAELNFCLHFVSGEYVNERTQRQNWDGTWYTLTQDTWKKHHRLIGKRVNVIATRNMAEYLEAAIEALVTEKVIPRGHKNQSRFANSFREGAAHTILLKLAERRSELLAEEERQAKKVEAEAQAAARAGISTATALTISSVMQTERDANMDHLYGEGWSAQTRAKRAEAAEKRRQAEEDYTRWAAAHPEEARKQAEEAKKEREKEEKRAARRSAGGGGKEYDPHAFWSGHDAAKSIGLEQQINTPVHRRLK